MKAPAVVVWFRDDLRLSDNPALEAARRTERQIVCLYVLDDETTRPLGAASRWWLDKSLRALDADLRARGASLTLRRGPAAKVVTAVTQEAMADEVFVNLSFEASGLARDKLVREALEARGARLHAYNGSLLVPPEKVANAEGKPFKVFSPFWRAAAPLAALTAPTGSPRELHGFDGELASDPIEAWGLHPTRPDWSQGFSEWAPGEEGAHARLDRFLKGAVNRYAEERDRPDKESTSRLSPHLAFGEISPRQVWAKAQAALHHGAVTKGVEVFLKELGWREFNHHLLHHFPQTVSDNLDRKFDAFPWRDDAKGLEAWRRGRTGYPIVDAGMRQLWATGWMHNRVRMIVASFLIKDLLIDWRIGEAWFWDTLVDADLGNNVGGWQWTAGSGADAAPYFRVFNPILQGEKFDPRGDYVRRWVPELEALPSACIHKPWMAGTDILKGAGVVFGRDYPAPIVDHAVARQRALSLFEGLK